MHRDGHLGASLLAYAPLGFLAVAAGFDRAAIAGALLAAGLSMAPDVDQRVPGLDHRGPTHTVWFAAVIAVLLGAGGAAVGFTRGSLLVGVALAVFGALVGATSILAHIAADALTPSGVRPFAPRRDTEYSLEVATAANPVANYAILAAGLGASALALWAGSSIASLFR